MKRKIIEAFSMEEAFRALNSKSVAKTKAVESKTAVKKKKLIESIEDDVDYAECIPEDMTQFFCINEEDNTNPNEYMPKNSYRGYKAVANLIACGDYADELRDCGYEYALLIADSADSFFVGYVAGDRLYELTEQDIYDQIGVNYDNDNDESDRDTFTAIAEIVPFADFISGKTAIYFLKDFNGYTAGLYIGVYEGAIYGVDPTNETADYICEVSDITSYNDLSLKANFDSDSNLYDEEAVLITEFKYDDLTWGEFIQKHYGDFMAEDVENSNNEMLTEATKKQLDSFAVKVKKELGGKFKVVGNSRTQCADILDNEENIIGQAYPKFRTVEIEKPITVKRLIHIKSTDEIQPDDEIYVKRSENSNMKKVADQIDYIKMVHGIVDSADAFIASVNKANDTDDLAMNADNRN